MYKYTLSIVIWYPSFSLKLYILSLFPVKPVAVHILVKEKFVSADKKIDVECKSSGSKPEAVITWLKGNKPLKRMSKHVSTQLIQGIARKTS